MSFRTHFAAALTLALVAAPSSASADSQWSTPAPLPVAGSVAVAANGQGVFAGQTTWASVSSDGKPSAMRPLGFFAQQVKAVGNEVIVAGQSIGEWSGGVPSVSRRSGVRVAVVDPNKDTVKVQALPRASLKYAEYLFGFDTNARGDAVLVVGDLVGQMTLWERKAGAARFSKSLRVRQTARAGLREAALSDSGTLVTSWQSFRKPAGHYVRTRSASGRWGAAQKLALGTDTVVRAAVDNTGRRYLATMDQNAYEGSGGNAVYKLATAAPGKPFGKFKQIGAAPTSGNGRYVDAPGVALEPATGGALVAWTSYESGKFVVRASAIRGGAVQSSQLLTPADQNSVLADLAVDAQGRVAAAWRAGIHGADADTDTLGGAGITLAGPDLAFGAPEFVTVEQPNGFTGPTKVSLSPVTGQPFVSTTGYHQGPVIAARVAPAR